MLTLTGPGGVGKTRLALAMASEVVVDFADGVAWVELAPLRDPKLVPAEVAGALGARERGEEPLADAIMRVVAGRQLLLVLNNASTSSRPPRWSPSAGPGPRGSVLTTSRTPLHVYGEQEYLLSPLALPDPARLPPLERLHQYAAVRLFIERARAVKPDFAVTHGNAPAVAEICSRLDGLPLAIELAAAFIKVLPPPALLKRLEKRLPLLTGGARTLPARQQTMRHAIAWSHDLLIAEEQGLPTIAVFRAAARLRRRKRWSPTTGPSMFSAASPPWSTRVCSVRRKGTRGTAVPDAGDGARVRVGAA